MQIDAADEVDGALLVVALFMIASRLVLILLQRLLLSSVTPTLVRDVFRCPYFREPLIIFRPLG
eukprot:3692957-Heterocapsa_arctica.AAC.1